MKLGYLFTSTVLSLLVGGGNAASDKVHQKGRARRRTAKRSKSAKPLELINSDCGLDNANVYKAECESFCTEFFEVCVNPNYFAATMSWNKCIKNCTAWPRTKAKVTRPPEKFNHLGGDTFACRDLHLWEAQIGDSPKNAAFHCFHSIDNGGDVCSDIEIDGKTPFETLRDSSCTHHHYGYCDLSGGNIGHETVADCMKSGVTDENLVDALRMLPSTIKILIMNENEGITQLSSGIFDNLQNPLKLKALYFDDCNITTIHEEAFWPLQNLEVLNLSFNKISILQDHLLKLPELRGFSIYGDPTPPESVIPLFGPGGGRKPGMITSDGFTANLFQYTPDLERLMMYGNRGIDTLHDGMFEGLSKVTSMFFVFCALDNDSFSADVFEPLVSMKNFDFQGNFFTKFDPAWFDGGWTSNIRRLAFFANQIEGPLEEDFETVFADMPKLQQVFIDQNPLAFIPAEYFENNPDLDTLTLGPAY